MSPSKPRPRRRPWHYSSRVSSVGYDRVVERRRAVTLARHFREAEGLSIAQIANRLARSPATVKAYFYDPSDANKRPMDSPRANAGLDSTRVRVPSSLGTRSPRGSAGQYPRRHARRRGHAPDPSRRSSVRQDATRARTGRGTRLALPVRPRHHDALIIGESAEGTIDLDGHRSASDVDEAQPGRAGRSRRVIEPLHGASRPPSRGTRGQGRRSRAPVSPSRRGTTRRNPSPTDFFLRSAGCPAPPVGLGFLCSTV